MANEYQKDNIQNQQLLMERKISLQKIYQNFANNLLVTGKPRHYRRVQHPLIKDLQKSINHLQSFHHQKDKQKQFRISYSKTAFHTNRKLEQIKKQRKKHSVYLNINNLNLASKLKYSRHFQPTHPKETSQYYLDPLNNIPIRISTQKNYKIFQSQGSFQKSQNINRKKVINRRYYQTASDSNIINGKYTYQKKFASNSLEMRDKVFRTKIANNVLLNNTQFTTQVDGWHDNKNDELEQLINI